MSVIIPTWNAADVLEACLDSLRRQEVRGGFETIVVDNGSTDGTAELLRRRAGEVQVISNETNVGFAAANNAAARGARGRVLLFLNSDTELLDSHALERLAQAVEEPGVGIAGPLLLNPDMSVQPSCARDPGVLRSTLVASGAWRVLPRRLLTRVAPDLATPRGAADVDWVMGAALAVRAGVFRQVGGFWPTMYAEDQDLALKARRAGFRVRFEPSARVLHVGNHSLAQRWASAERADRVANAELVFLATHYSRPRRAAIRAVVGAGYGARALAHRVLGRREPAGVYAAMLRRYLTGPAA